MPEFIVIKGLGEVKSLVKNIGSSVPGFGKAVLREMGKRMKTYAKANVNPIYPKRDTSEDLKGSITRRTGKDFVRVVAETSYASYVETGTEPSTTNYPRPVKIGDSWYYMRSHPGAKNYPSQHFMSKAFDRVVSESNEIIESEYNNFIQEVNK